MAQNGAGQRRGVWYRLLEQAAWRLIWTAGRIWFMTCYRYRSCGGKRVPRSGGVLLLVNHQSFLDPVLVGVSCNHRRFFSLARESLFKGAFGRVIRLTRAIPVSRGGQTGDLAALRQCVEKLKAGETLLIFPEGTRTSDGTIGPWQDGVMLLIKRAKPLVVPTAIDGAFEVWPRDRKAPSLRGCIRVGYARPREGAELATMPAAEAMATLRSEAVALQERLAKWRRGEISRDEVCEGAR